MMWILLLLLVLAASAAELRVELAAPWRTSRHLETAAFLFNQNQRDDFWDFVLQQQNTLQLDKYEPFLALALQSGEYVPYVEAHAQLASDLQRALEISPISHNFAVFDHEDGSVHAFGIGEGESEQCRTAAKLEVFESTDFLLPQQKERQLVCVIFGDFESADFYQLFASVKGRLGESHRIVLRMNPPRSGEADAKLGGFSVSLDIKNTEYVQTTQANDGSSKESGIDFAKLVERFPAKQDSLNHLKRSLKANRERLNPWEIADVSIQFALHVLQQQDGQSNATRALQEIKLLSENLPSFVRQLTEIPVSDAVQDQVAKLKVGLRSQLYINSHSVDSNLPVHKLVRLLQQEEELVALQQLVAANSREFAQWIKPNSARVDVRKFAKGAVMFLNDIEKDAMYRAMPSAAIAQQFKLQQQQQLVQVRRNLYTAILTVDASKPEQTEMLAIVRHFARMGAPIRFGLVFASSSSSECSKRATKLVFAAKKEYGLDAALQFAQIVQGNGACEDEDLVEAFASALAKATKSWTKSKFTTLAKQALSGEDTEEMERSNRYIRELGLPVPGLTFNGQLLDKLSSQVRLDRLLQDALFAEQEFIRVHVAELDESQDILSQLLHISRAKPKLSKFRDQVTYIDAVPDTATWEYTTKGQARVTVWLSPSAAVALQQSIIAQNADVRVATWGEAKLFSSNVTCVVNGRLVSSKLTLEDLQELVDLERDRMSAVPKEKSADELLVCSVAMHKMTMTQGNSPVPAISSLDDFSIVDEEEESWRVLTLVVNPLDANTPKLVAMANWLKSSSLWQHAKVQIQLAPEVDVAHLPPASFHRWSSTDTKVTFDTSLVPAGQVLTLKMQANANWIVFPNLDASRDPDNLVLQQDDDQYTASYQVAHVLVDGHSYVEHTGEPAAGMQLELVPRVGLVESQALPIGDSIVMYNLGYWQIKAKPGFYSVRPKRDVANKFTSQAKPVDLHTFAGPGVVQLTAQPSSSVSAVKEKDDDGTMHVFSLASGALYERFLRIMMLSVRKRSTGKLKFWLLENYMSKEMKQFLPEFAERNEFTYELVTFKWPEWLRGQSERQRQIWGMKILFLDVLFPLNLKRVIYVDADQVLRADLRELWNMDLHGAPYAMTPFCDSRKETLGFQFWRQGFWAQHLRGKPYHISALFVVDLEVFRRDSVGDRLRAIYQQLSSDPGSLSNLDQDLPNFAQQHDIHIFSLPQEWLWCESWCSDESLAKAKTIDLCNNPLRKEPKLDMARRVIRGEKFQESWEQLDEEVQWK